MNEEDDLEQILLGIQHQQVVSLADPAAEAVYVVTDSPELGPKEELAMAGAFMGGIQQRLFDIAAIRDRTRKGNSDVHRAANAMISGDAALIANGYISEAFTEEEFEVLVRPIPGNKLLAAPEVIQATTVFGQTSGRDFVSTVWGTEGWAAVDALYKRPPASTEQVLHPEKYFEDEQPLRAVTPNFAEQIGKGWVQVANNAMGEFLIRTYLEQHLPDNQAADAAAGWGGDSYALFSGPAGERVMVMQIFWDTLADSDEFFNAYKVFGTVHLPGSKSEAIGSAGWKWEAADETIFVGQQGQVSLLVIGPTFDLVDSALSLLVEALTTEREIIP